MDVYTTRSFQAFKDYQYGQPNAKGWIQCIDEGKHFSIRAKWGRLGFKGSFNKENQEEMSLHQTIREWCKTKKFIPIEESMPEEFFFK